MWEICVAFLVTSQQRQNCTAQSTYNIGGIRAPFCQGSASGFRCRGFFSVHTHVARRISAGLHEPPFISSQSVTDGTMKNDGCFCVLGTLKHKSIRKYAQNLAKQISRVCATFLGSNPSVVFPAVHVTCKQLSCSVVWRWQRVI